MIMTLLREAIGGKEGLVGKAGGVRVESLRGTGREGTSERATRRRQACGCGKVMRLAGGLRGRSVVVTGEAEEFDETEEEP
jgi:hypothetical protein